ncbi:MAG: restriction endonuclease subunit S [Neisseria sp.]|uniref:restriction endonuclease subunit S n=1 Tax=Neisseria sp. TaxID=192066 RepID=UPI001CAEC9BE|nr:restriction endonuclease subunit S [Neisseria sp.]MBF1300960.1 restriction endonuclease subunit S [Neisseria sp.]
MKRQITIGEIAEINANSLTQKGMFQEIMYLDTGNITRNEIDNIQILNITMDKIPSRAKRKVKDKTIIYSTVRPNQEHYGFLENPSDNFIVSTGFSTIDVYDDNTDEKFIYYLLTQKHITDYLHTIGENSVSSYPSINPDDIANLKFTVPDLKTQQSITAILSALDKKIALNKQINARLEEMAKTLYDYWFVQFDFPDANGKPYKSSGGEMVFDETLKREIPKGWEVKNLGEIATLKAGGDKPKLISQVQTQEYKFPIYSNGLNDNALYGYCKKAIITEPSITISARGTIGFTKIRNHSFTPIIRLISVTPKNNQFIKFLELFLSQTSFENAGSVQKQLTIPQIENVKILIPNIKLIKKFSDITTFSVGLIESNEKQNHQLTQLRDFLLPMLMNGQVSVAE